MTQNAIAKVFMSGRSQAVRIPKDFRFSTPEVTIVKRGESLILTPHQAVTWDRFFADFTCPDFALDRTESQRGQERVLF